MDISFLMEKAKSKLGLKNLFRPIYYAFEDFIEAGLVKKNEALKDLHKNERCFILGNGVSLNEINIRKLANEWTFGCNCIYHHKDAAELNLKFFVSASAVRKSNKASIDRLINHFSIVETTFSNPNTTFFVRAVSKNLFERRNIFQHRRVYYLKPKQPLPIKQAIKVPIDITKRSCTLYGSVTSMITIAIYMGFKELYLCGCGYTYEPQQVYHFYDYDPTLTSADKMQDASNASRPFFPLTIPEDKRKEMINEFASGRLEVYKTWHEDSYEKVTFVRRHPLQEEHELFEQIAKLNGVKIYNIVPDGLESPIYEKITWQKVESKILSRNPDNM